MTIYRIASWKKDQRQVVATEAIPKGTIIIREEPIVWIQIIDQRHSTFQWDLVDKLLSDHSKYNTLLGWKLRTTPTSVWDVDDERKTKRFAKAFGTKKHTVKYLYNLICTNNVACFSEKYEEIIGYGMFHKLSLINHDCVPNSMPIASNPSKGEMSIISTRDIKQGESITMTYLDDDKTTLNVEQRRKWLEYLFGFKCECKRCCEETL